LSILKDGLRLEEIRKGMCLIDLDESPVASKVFEAEIWSADNNKKVVKFKSEPVVTIKHIRQICKLKKLEGTKISKDDGFVISPDERITIIFEFKNYPEYIKKNDNIIIFEGSLKAFGVITNIIK
jgi:GTPase